MAGPYTDEQIINFIIELRTRPNNPLTENKAIAAVQDTYGISDERISQIENSFFQQADVFFNPVKSTIPADIETDPISGTLIVPEIDIEEIKIEAQLTARTAEEFFDFLEKDEEIFPPEWKELFSDTNPNKERNKEKLKQMYADLNSRLDRVYIEDEGLFYELDQKDIDDRNELVRNNNIPALLEFDEMENLQFLNLGTRELTLEEVAKAKADAQGYYFKQDISFGEVLTSLEETFDQVKETEEKLGINTNTQSYKDNLIQDIWNNQYSTKPSPEKIPPTKLSLIHI